MTIPRLLIDTFFRSRSVRISNPTDYAQLLTDDFDADPDDNIVIDWRAHPDILSQPRHFVNATYPTVCFEDGPRPYQSNRICFVRPQVQLVRGVFFAGSNLTYGIAPTTWVATLYYGSNASCTDADLEPIMTWTRASEIYLLESSGHAGVYFSQHASQFRHFDELNFIGLIANPHNYDRVQVAKLMDNVKSLDYLVFHVNALSERQVAEFAAQPIPDGWRVEVRRDEHNEVRVVAWLLKDRKNANKLLASSDRHMFEI